MTTDDEWFEDWPERPLKDDGQLIKLIREKYRFEKDIGMSPADQLELIKYFLDCYNNTNQDTVLFAPEFKIVVENILALYRPTKLHYLTDFEGEEK